MYEERMATPTTDKEVLNPSPQLLYDMLRHIQKSYPDGSRELNEAVWTAIQEAIARWPKVFSDSGAKAIQYAIDAQSVRRQNPDR